MVIGYDSISICNVLANILLGVEAGLLFFYYLTEFFVLGLVGDAFFPGQSGFVLHVFVGLQGWRENGLHFELNRAFRLKSHIPVVPIYTEVNNVGLIFDRGSDITRISRLKELCLTAARFLMNKRPIDR
jgi:hypothetical protein